MKLTVNRKEFATAVGQAAKFLPRFTAIPTLGHLLFEVHSNQLMVSATNLDAGRTVEVEADIASEGRELLPPEVVAIAKKAGGQKLTIEASTDVTITDGVSTWTLPLGAIDDYPEISHDVSGDGKVGDWTHIQAVAKFADSGKGSRPTLEGVHFGDGWAAATNSYRLAWTESEVPDALVPAYAIANIGGVSKLGVGERHASAVVEDGVWWTRLIDGHFPNWQALLPSDHDVEAVVSSEVLSDALGRAALTANEVNNGKLVTLDFGDGILVKAEGFTEIVEAEVSGSATIAVNIKYLLDALAPVEQATIRFKDAYKPILFEQDWWRALIMPVRV